MRNPNSRANMLKTHVVEQLQHVFQQTDLPLAGWRKSEWPPSEL
jgi:hypothetical protein